MADTSQHRPLYEIAREIRADWPNVYYAAAPYLRAMGQMSTVNDAYGHDDARTVVLYFLQNASTWRGPVARSLKAELKAMVKR